MGESPQDRGREFERELAAETGLERDQRSGAGAYKLDVAGGQLRISAKHTDTASIRIDAAMLQELRDATSGPGGAGTHQVGVVVARLGGISRDVAVLEWGDLLGLLGSLRDSITPSKDRVRRAGASLPTALRD